MLDEKDKRDGPTVTRLIREEILRLELRPGAVLDEGELAARMKVSRTPVREAIIQLIADGLVERRGRKALVAALDFDEVPKLYDALLISSRMIHRLAAENRTDVNLGQIEAAMVEFECCPPNASGVDRSQTNVRFHKAISDAAHNRFIATFYETVLTGTARLARACFANAGKMEYHASLPSEDITLHIAETARQHRAIFAALLTGDIELSDQLAVEHYNLTRRRVERVIFGTSSALVNVTL